MKILLVILLSMPAFAARSPWVFDNTNVRMLSGGSAIQADGTAIGGSGGGGGDIFGPASSTALQIGVFSNTSGKSMTNSSARVSSGALLAGTNGNGSAAALSFVNDPNSGLTTDGSDYIAMNTNGNTRQDWYQSYSGFYTQIRHQGGGTVSLPDYAFGDADTGMYYPATNTLGLTANGTMMVSAGPENVKVTTLFYVNATSLPSILVMKSPDGTCARCGISDSDVFTCSSITCP